MDEAEWLSCTDPQPMLAFLKRTPHDRKLRLFAVASCRHVWPFMVDERSRKAVEISEAYADGAADRQALQRARDAASEAEAEAFEAVLVGGEKGRECPVREAAVFTAMAIIMAFRVASLASRAGVWAFGGGLEEMQAAKVGEDTYQCALVRDLFGNPFRSSVLDRIWLTAHVVRLARTAYEERVPPTMTLDADRLAVLADALEDAGCDNADILAHLREPSPHVRGCWVIDLLLGKE
jgi:hypothetical protein